MIRTAILRTTYPFARQASVMWRAVPRNTPASPPLVAHATALASNPKQGSMTEQQKNSTGDLPADLLYTTHNPQPVRHEILMSDKPLKTEDLEKIDISIDHHREPVTFSDRIAFYIVKALRKPTDWFFKKKYVHRAVMLETVAAVPGMVAGTIRHLRSLRKMSHDGGWIDHLLHEAENERMHLLTWMRISKPSMWERALVFSVQGVFYNAFFALYLISPRTAHRMVGYLEEEAIISYTSFLNEIDNGNISNDIEVPDIAIDYWHLDRKTATLRDVVLAVRADEATHRDVNHCLSDRIVVGREDLRVDIKQALEKATVASKVPVATKDASIKWQRV